MRHPAPGTNLLTRGLKLSHLRLIVAMADQGGIQAAADHLAMSQPAASRMTREIERIVGGPVHRRVGRGIEMTALGRALALRAARILQEIDDTEIELRSIHAGTQATMRIGAVTSPAIEIVMPLMRETRLLQPGLTLEVEVATSDILGQATANGEMDFYLGRLPAGLDPDFFETTPIAAEPICFLARADHPLAGVAAVSAADLVEYDWILPFDDAILTKTVTARLRALGVTPPKHVYSTSSFLLTLSLVRKSNAVAPIARAVGDVFANAADGMASLRQLSCRDPFEVETYALIKAANRNLPDPSRQIYEKLRTGLAQDSA